MPSSERADHHAYTYLSSDARERVDALASRKGLSRSAWIRMVILERLRHEEERSEAVAR